MTGEQIALPVKLPVARTVLDGYWWAIWHLRTTVGIALAWATVVVFLERFLRALPVRIAGLPEDAFGDPGRRPRRARPALPSSPTCLGRSPPTIPGLLWEPSFSPVPNSLHTGLSTFITLLSTAFAAMVFGKAFAAIADRQREGIYGVFD